MQNSLEIVTGHFKNLLMKCLQTNDENERELLVRRLINLCGVIQFLIVVKNTIAQD